ncbi:MAG: primosomal protein N' [Phycisphaerae bacterium]|jgi:primosomal protein N' (replication factor Y)|nr:primosomal protein N' [Phycisphaerae bacterium]
MSRLFEEPDDARAQPDEATHMPVDLDGADVTVAVAVAANVWRTYDYLWPATMGRPQVGQRVRVPFGRGNRPMLAFVTRYRGADARRGVLKSVGELIDAESQFNPVCWKLGQWISRYYLTPLGMALAAMIPSAIGRFAGRSETVVYLAVDPAEAQVALQTGSLGARQRQALDELIEARSQGVEPLTLQGLMQHSGAARNSIVRLQRRGLVRTDSRPVRLGQAAGDREQAAETPFELNADQQAVLAAMQSKLGGGFSATLLYGVTSSGKTEIYVRAIRQVAAAGKQAILLVPEIALATQTLQRLVKRLERVAVLHSALSDAQRAFYFEQIRDGHASVVIGPRSAVFAPARKLGLIVVDEEHEGTYKQDTVPRYHGRDVAVMRASLASVPVLLGSATPSLESLHNVQTGRYEMLRLPSRVRGVPMPRLEIVPLRQEIRSHRVELIGRTLTRQLAAALDRREQVILLMNRRGFASYVFCPHCKWELTCDRCTRPMVFHRATEMVMCHYCQHTASLPERCPACEGKLLLFGMGIQRIQGELARKFPDARVARIDSDTMTSQKQFQKVFDAYSAGELDILLGTQMVAKGLDFPRVSLVGVLSADTSLSLPDFRSSERTFQLIVQVAGRAGRAEVPGLVIVQTLHADEPAVLFASRHDYDGFARIEMSQRREAQLPPFSRMIRFLVRHEKADRAAGGAEALAGALQKLLGIRARNVRQKPITMMGPKRAEIEKIRDRFRFDILLILGARNDRDTGSDQRAPGWMQRVLYPRMEEICRGIRAEVLADVDPVNLM